MPPTLAELLAAPMTAQVQRPVAHPPTPEQQAIATAVRGGGNIIIRALAGTGKTTTLVDYVAPNLDPAIPVLALAFNVKIKDELQRRFPSHVTVKTLNALGNAAWGRAIRRYTKPDGRKLGKITTTMGKAYGLTREQWDDTISAVNLAMQWGLIPNQFPHKGLIEDSPRTWIQIADEAQADHNPKMLKFYHDVLVQSIKQSMIGDVSFDDQVYMSALFGGDFPRFGVVLVDEAQDLSPLNHIQIAKCAADRLIITGDSRQAIYGFRGADEQSMDKLRNLRSEWTECTLSTTFRVPPTIVARQLGHAPGFNSFKTEPGEFYDWVGLGWSWNAVEAAATDKGDIAFLCRNNAPLLSMAFKLIRQGIAPNMLGRDIGKGLVKLSKDLCKRDTDPANDLVIKANTWMQTQRQVHMANNDEHKIEPMEDKGESLIAVVGSLGPSATVGNVRNAITALFDREDGYVTLATGHKAKGLEFSTVVIIDPWRIPSKFAVKCAARGNSGPLEQEKNVMYVMETRTKNTLIHASLADFH